MARDQEIVKQLQRRLAQWNPEGTCPAHKQQRCVSEEQGRLIKLHLCRLGLTQIPSEVWHLTALQELCLNDNRLSSLPREVGQLSALQVLDLTNNQLSSLPPEIGTLSSLQKLWLEENQLSSLPREVGQLSSLEVLALGHNQLSNVPREIGQLSALQVLALNDNQLSSLPEEVGQLSSLYGFVLDRNPLQLPPEVEVRGASAQLAYLRGLHQASVERFEAKVILVGEGGMGKTSLLRTLRQAPFTPDLPATHGIEVNTFFAPHPMRAGVSISLYAWDFGGQEIYQATHQFFLTRRSVYLLVWNARLGAEACRLAFWLDTITAHAPDAKILLVATHRDLWSKPALNLASYQQRYPQIAGLCTVSNRSGEGLDDLKGRLVALAAETPLVGQIWPRSWLNAEQALLSRPEHHIDAVAFATLCRQHQIEDETERETFGRYLHDLGKILYFHDDPVLRTLVVLKPNWISKAISQVLTDQAVEQAGGVLEHQDLARIWATDEQGHPYPSSLYPIFLRLMERFALCYQLEPERPGQPPSQSLIPQLLPEQPPVAIPLVPTVPEEGQVRVAMHYTLSFIPAGLMSWFLVRTHRYSQRLHWREGARLAYAGQQAEITLDHGQREISITVWGPFPYTFLLILKQTLDDLLSTFQGLRVQSQVPCRCTRQREVSHTHSYEDLERRLARGETEIVCAEGERLSLATLLYGMHASTLPQMERTVQQTQQLVARQLAPAPQAQLDQVPAEELRRMLVRLDQGQEFLYRTMLQQQQQQLKLERQKISNACPGLFVLERVARRPLNPHNWVSRAYHLRLLCQYPQGPHPIAGEEGYEVRQGEAWWNAMSPWLRRMVKVLEIGVPLGQAVNEAFKLVDIERFAPEIDVFKEILDDLPEIEGIEALSDAHLDGRAQTRQRLEGAAAEALHTFLQSHPRPWQGLHQVITDDGAIWWLCDQHRQEIEGHLLAEAQQINPEQTTFSGPSPASSLLPTMHVSPPSALPISSTLSASVPWAFAFPSQPLAAKPGAIDVLCTFNDHTKDVPIVALGADGRIMASAGLDQKVRLWDVSTGQLLPLPPEAEKAENPLCMALSADGSTLAYTYETGVINSYSHETGCHIWSVRNAQFIGDGRVKGYWGLPASILLSADGLVFACCSVLASPSRISPMKAVLIYNLQVNMETPFRTLPTETVARPRELQESFALSPSGLRLARGYKYRRSSSFITIANTQTGDNFETNITPKGGEGEMISSLAFNADGSLLASGSLDGSIKLWEVQRKKLRLFHTLSCTTKSMALTHDGLLLVSVRYGDKSILLWDTKTGKLLGTLQSPTGTVSSVALSADGRVLASGCSDGTIHLWGVKP